MCDWGGIEGQFNTHRIGSGNEELIMYDWEFHDDMIDLWLFMMKIRRIILDIHWNKNWERVWEKGLVIYYFEKTGHFWGGEFWNLSLHGFLVFHQSNFKRILCFQTFQIRKAHFHKSIQSMGRIVWGIHIPLKTSLQIPFSSKYILVLSITLGVVSQSFPTFHSSSFHTFIKYPFI